MWVKKRSNKKKEKQEQGVSLRLSWQRQIGRKAPPLTHTRSMPCAPNRTQCGLPLRTVWAEREVGRKDNSGHVLEERKGFSAELQKIKSSRSKKNETPQRSRGKWVRGHQNMVGTEWILNRSLCFSLSLGWPASLPWARRRIKSDWTKAIDTGKGKLLVCL